RRLDLDGTRVSDEGMPHLSSLSSLEVLSLDRTRVNGAGLARLKDLPHLWALSLAETRVTDAGLAQLKAFSKLQSLHLNDTRVSSPSRRRHATDTLRPEPPGNRRGGGPLSRGAAQLQHPQHFGE